MHVRMTLSISDTGSGVGLVVGCSSAGVADGLGGVADGLATDGSGGIAHPVKSNEIQVKPIAYWSILRGLILHSLSACCACLQTFRCPLHHSAEGIDCVGFYLGYHVDFRLGCYAVVLGASPSISLGPAGVNTLTTET